MEEYKKWLRQAEDDLKWAKSSADSEIYYGACFAAQQVIEKSLKAFLIFHKRPFKKTHDVMVLLEDCFVVDKAFENLRLAIGVVVPYYVETRYPEMIEQAGFNEAGTTEAYRAAERVIDFVKERIK